MSASLRSNATTMFHAAKHDCNFNLHFAFVAHQLIAYIYILFTYIQYQLIAYIYTICIYTIYQLYTAYMQKNATLHINWNIASMIKVCVSYVILVTTRNIFWLFWKSFFILFAAAQFCADTKWQLLCSPMKSFNCLRLSKENIPIVI